LRAGHLAGRRIKPLLVLWSSFRVAARVFRWPRRSTPISRHSKPSTNPAGRDVPGRRAAPGHRHFKSAFFSAAEHGVAQKKVPGREDSGSLAAASLGNIRDGAPEGTSSRSDFACRCGVDDGSFETRKTPLREGENLIQTACKFG